MSDTDVTFPELRALMAKYGLTKNDMGNLIETTYGTFSKKLNLQYFFNFPEMLKIFDFFKSKGEDITIDKLFFEWKLSNERGEHSYE
jgi:hypothetical protein